MASTSFESLALRLDRLADEAAAGATTAIASAALVADQVLVLETPVDLGHARAGWTVSFGSPDLTIPPKDQRDKSGNATLEKNRRAILTFRVGQELFISNAVPYIGLLDGGSSKQTPEGMSRAAVEAAFAFLRKFRYLPPRGRGRSGGGGRARDERGKFI